MTITQFTLIYDTYCGWCYGAAKIFEALSHTNAQIECLHRGLFQGSNRHRMADSFGKITMQHDQHISNLTGQIFSPAYMDNIIQSPEEILDSELTARAAALVHDQGSKSEIALAHRLQQARFIEGISAQDPEPVIAAVQQLTPTTDTDQIRNLLNAETTIAKAAEIKQRAIQLLSQVGVQGVPTLIREVDNRREIINLNQFHSMPETVTRLLTL